MAAELVGLLPCAGRATRLGGGLGSKELLPVRHPERASEALAPVCEHLLGQMRRAEIRRVWVVLRAGKWDIPQTLGDGSEWGLDLGYLTLRQSESVPETLDRAYRHLRDLRVAVGFPDVIATPVDALARLAEHQASAGSDIALALFPTDRPDKADMVEVDAAGNLLRIEIKPGRSALRFTWLLAIWGPAATEHLHRFVAAGGEASGRELGREPFLSDFVLSAQASGLRISTLAFEHGSHLDIGTPEDLERAGGRNTTGLNRVS
jgi:glucose-1-phosphate thymidylyltransferase